MKLGPTKRVNLIECSASAQKRRRVRQCEVVELTFTSAPDRRQWVCSRCGSNSVIALDAKFMCMECKLVSNGFQDGDP
jgi:hypothetical protein